MASVLSVPDNQSEDKHVESSLVPRLDEGSNPSSSTKTLKINIFSVLQQSHSCLFMSVTVRGN